MPWSTAASSSGNGQLRVMGLGLRTMARSMSNEKKAHRRLPPTGLGTVSRAQSLSCIFKIPNRFDHKGEAPFCQAQRAHGHSRVARREKPQACQENEKPESFLAANRLSQPVTILRAPERMQCNSMIAVQARCTTQILLPDGSRR